MRLRTDSYLSQMHVYLARTSKEMHMDPDVSICPILSTYVGMQWGCGDDVVDLPPHIPMRIWFNTSDLTQQSGLVTRIASDLGWARKKIPLYCMEYNRPTTRPDQLHTQRGHPWDDNLWLFWGWQWTLGRTHTCQDQTCQWTCSLIGADEHKGCIVSCKGPGCGGSQESVFSWNWAR